ncbi:MAG: hypothetical protein ACREO6_00780 [Rudaea sp.]
MTQQEVFAGGNATPEQAVWDAEVRERALARLSRRAGRRPATVWLLALIALAGLHAVFFWHWSQNRFSPVVVAADMVMEVSLVDEPVPPRAPEPVAPPRTAAHMAAAMLPAVPPPVSAPVPAPVVPSAPVPQLFDPDGALRLPSEARFVAPHDVGIARGKELLARGHNLIHCRRSQFDDSPTPAQAAAAAASGAHMAHLVMGNPLDPLNDVGQQQVEDAAGEHAAEKRRIEEQACDY